MHRAIRQVVMEAQERNGREGGGMEVMEECVEAIMGGHAAEVKLTAFVTVGGV